MQSWGIDLSLFAGFVERAGNLAYVDELNPAFLDKFREHIKGGVAVSTWNRIATSLKRFLRYMHGYGAIQNPLYDVVPRFKE